MISAADIKIDDDANRMTLRRASIINGAQSQGEIWRYLGICQKKEEEPNFFHVRAEIIVEKEADFVVETAIARNTSTQVAALSQAGKRKAFDELEKGFQK